MKELQEKIRIFCKQNKMENAPEYCLIDLVSEIGEASKEILKMTDYGKSPIKYREEIIGELGDVSYSLITLANSLDVDLEEASDLVLTKYQKRLTKGSASSESE